MIKPVDMGGGRIAAVVTFALVLGEFSILPVVRDPRWGQCLAADASGNAKDKRTGPTPEMQPNAEVHIDFEDPDKNKPHADADIVPYAQPLDDIFRNPAVVANLASGAEAINRSVETVMEQIFYSLLDNERNLDLTDDSWFYFGLKRKLLTTPSGSYVVVDRFTLGPRYAKQLWQVQNIPVTLGIDGSVDVMQIYLRNDGMRLAEQNELPTWRRLANNWFGLVPLLAAILPPSFNQNNLYDPLRQLETPFSFPLEVEKFYSMPIGSIRSYSISGGIRLSPDLGGLVPKSAQDELNRIAGLQQGIPYSLFKTGEHRINVLRFKDQVAWVGVTNTNRTGHSISPLVGQTYFILQGMLAANISKYKWVWKGRPVSLLPIDLSFEQALVKIFDQVYEYDLSIPAAQAAYEDAVRGDFQSSRERYLDAKEKHLDTGVTFHFASQQERKETISHNGPNVIVFKRERQRDHHAAEIEITDQEGKFFVLESTVEVADKITDVLVGNEQSRTQHMVEMKVKKVINRDNPEEYTYAFELGPDPYRLTMGLSIQDKYTDTREYRDYIDELRFFTGLPLRDVPNIPLIDAERHNKWRRQGYFSGPRQQTELIHTAPTYIGDFGAQATLSFSTKQIDRIVNSEVDDIWAAFGQAFGYDQNLWRDPEFRQGMAFNLNWVKALLLYPLRILNVRVAPADAVAETTNAVAALKELKGAKTPLEKLEAVRHLLDTDHPETLGRALLDLADLGEIPRRVTFNTKAKGPLPDAIKTAWNKLDNQTFRGGPPFPDVGRYARARAKLANFYLDRPHFEQDRPHIDKIQVTTRQIPESIRALSVAPGEPVPPRGMLHDERQVYMTFTVQQPLPPGPLKVYIKIQEGGRLKLGKLDLSEKVVELLPLNSGGLRAPATFEMFLTGPLSPMSNFMLDRAVAAGDEFQVTISVSKDGNIWGDERNFEFQYTGGHIYPAS